MCKSHCTRNHLPTAGLVAKMLINENGYDWIIAVANSHHSQKKKQQEQSSLIIWSTETKSGFSIPIDQGHVTCMSSHQESGLLVMGHESGEIVIWHHFKKWLVKNQNSLPVANDGEYDPKKPNIVSLTISEMPLRTKLHWHAHPVSCVSLSSDGRSIYSGGEEGVLVKWHVGSDSNERRSFIPRLGGAISNISSSDVQSKAVISLKDNSVRIVDFARLVDIFEKQSHCLSSFVPCL